MVTSVGRAEVLGFRVHAQQLDRPAGGLADTAVLDIGAQDTGTDGGLWALAIRGVDVAALAGDALATVWTVRAAPHLYLRSDLAQVAAATAPFSEEDARKRLFDAAKRLTAGGIGVVAALDTVAAAMRSVVTGPTVKGDVSTRLTPLLAEPYLRYCRSCAATHPLEMPFRLAALRAGLELEAGTSPPVLRPIPGFRPAAAASDRLDVIRCYLRLLGPATPKHVAEYLDAPVREVKARWPADAVEVTVAGQARWVLAADVDRLAAGRPRLTRLLGGYDLFLQARDRPLLVDDPARAKALWPVLGRPGAVLVDGEVAGTWRARTASGRLTLQVQPWTTLARSARVAVTDQAERLAAYRRVRLSGVDIAADR